MPCRRAASRASAVAARAGPIRLLVFLLRLPPLAASSAFHPPLGAQHTRPLHLPMQFPLQAGTVGNNLQQQSHALMHQNRAPLLSRLRVTSQPNRHHELDLGGRQQLPVEHAHQHIQAQDRGARDDLERPVGCRLSVVKWWFSRLCCRLQHATGQPLPAPMHTRSPCTRRMQLPHACKRPHATACDACNPPLHPPPPSAPLTSALTRLCFSPRLKYVIIGDTNPKTAGSCTM
jgi:hypothetical protein